MTSLFRLAPLCLLAAFAAAGLRAQTKLSLAPQNTQALLAPIELTVPAGESVTVSFPCTTPVLWIKNDLPLSSPNVSGGTLAIPSATPDDAGTYYVLYEGNTITGSQELILKVAPATAAAPASPRFLVFTARGLAGSGEQALITAFAIDEVPGNPDAKKLVLIRAVGPTLAEFGVTAPLASPQLTVRGKGGVPVEGAFTDRDALRDAEIFTGAYPLLPGRGDAAQLLRLSPGVYTAQVSSADGKTGPVLFELYEVPE